MVRTGVSALVLILVAPLIAEVLPGSAPLSHPGILPFIFLIYGPGALLIRELAVRSGRSRLFVFTASLESLQIQAGSG